MNVYVSIPNTALCWYFISQLRQWGWVELEETRYRNFSSNKGWPLAFTDLVKLRAPYLLVEDVNKFRIELYKESL